MTPVILSLELKSSFVAVLVFGLDLKKCYVSVLSCKYWYLWRLF